MKLKRLYTLYNVFDHFVQHCYLLYNIVTDVQRYNLYNQDKKIVQSTNRFTKVLINILFCIVQSIQNLFERIVQRFKTLCTIFVNEVVQVVQVVRIGRELQHCTSCTTFCTIL